MSFLLQQALISPHDVPGMDAVQLGQLVSQGRSTRLLASLEAELKSAELLDQVPVAFRRHLESARLVHEKQKHDLNYDIELLRQTFSAQNEKLVLLKGAAYLQGTLSVGSGRYITDIDVIVPQARIAQIEKALNQSGWDSSYVDSYNEKYYRQWMHEIPPLSHQERGTTLDLHHTILPPTAKARIDANLLFDKLTEIKPGVYSLCPEDMVIHSATHLFHEGEFHHGLRDLWDLHKMMTGFAEQDEGFWENLVARASKLDLLTSLFHGMTYTQRVFQTPVPAAAYALAGSVLRNVRKPIMNLLFSRAFTPPQKECVLVGTGPCLYALYIRSHYLRMPPHLLIPHLVRKAWYGRVGESESPDSADREKNLTP